MTGPRDELQEHIADLERQLERARTDAKELEQLELKHEKTERLFAEYQEAEIDNEIRNANAWLSRLLKAMVGIEKLAKQYPAHPKLAAFAPRLDILVGSIEQFSRKVGRVGEP